MPITNTLENARRLESLGFSHQQAQAVAEVVESAAQDARGEVATKEFVRTEIKDLESGIRTEMKDLELRIRTEMKDLELRIAERLRAQMIWFFAVQFAVQAALVGGAVAVLKLLP